MPVQGHGHSDIRPCFHVRKLIRESVVSHRRTVQNRPEWSGPPCGACHGANDAARCRLLWPVCSSPRAARGSLRLLRPRRQRCRPPARASIAPHSRNRSARRTTRSITSTAAWLAKTEIPADKSSYGSFDMLIDKSQADLRAIVEDAAKAPNKTAGIRPAEDRRLLRELHERSACRGAGAEAARSRARRDRSARRPRRTWRAISRACSS